MQADIAPITAPWSDLATAALARMREEIARRSPPFDLAPLGKPTDEDGVDDAVVQELLDELSGQTNDAESAASDPDGSASEAAPKSGAQSAATARQPARPRIPVRRLLLALRLAVTLGDKAGMARPIGGSRPIPASLNRAVWVPAQSVGCWKRWSTSSRGWSTSHTMITPSIRRRRCRQDCRLPLNDTPIGAARHEAAGVTVAAALVRRSFWSDPSIQQGRAGIAPRAGLA